VRRREQIAFASNGAPISGFRIACRAAAPFSGNVGLTPAFLMDNSHPNDETVEIFLQHGLTQRESQNMIGGSLTTRAAQWLLFEYSRHEKNVSTEQDQACSHPWISRT